MKKEILENQKQFFMLGKVIFFILLAVMAANMYSHYVTKNTTILKKEAYKSYDVGIEFEQLEEKVTKYAYNYQLNIVYLDGNNIVLKNKKNWLCFEYYLVNYDNGKIKTKVWNNYSFLFGTKKNTDEEFFNEVKILTSVSADPQAP